MQTISRIAIQMLKYSVVGASIAYLILSGKLDFGIFLRIQSSNIWLAGITASLISCVFCLSFLRFWILLLGCRIRLSLLSVSRIGIIGIFFNTFMFGGTGGDVVKVIYVARASKNRVGTLAATLLDRVIGLCALLLIGQVAILVSYQTVANTPPLHTLAITTNALLSCALACLFCGFVSALHSSRYGWLSLMALSVVVAGGGRLFIKSSLFMNETDPESHGIDFGMGLVLGWLTALTLAAIVVAFIPGCLPGGWLEKWIRKKVPLGNHLMHMMESLLLYRHELPSLCSAFALSILLHLLNIGALFFCARMLPLDPQPYLSHIIFAAPMTLIANALPLPGGGAGVGEAAFDKLLHLCYVDGHAVTRGAMVFLLYRLCGIFLSLCGIPFYLNSTHQELRQEKT